ncbi:MAG: DUF1295 domain-containing protein [Nitriliruptoraceae bacterium]
MFAATVAAVSDVEISGRAALVLVAVTVWGLRLSAHITWRNWGHGEDPRYAAMRARRPATFAWRSLVTVFVLQAALSALVGTALLAAIATPNAPALWWLDGLALAVWVVGFVFETVGDAQLARFGADPANRTRVLDSGLWRYTRHPNYFGDATVWAGFGLFAVAAGAWWGLLGAALMGVLIVRVSGVALTDRTMAQSSRRVGYEDYVRRTNAFFPGPVRTTPSSCDSGQ